MFNSETSYTFKGEGLEQQVTLEPFRWGCSESGKMAVCIQAVSYYVQPIDIMEANGFEKKELERILGTLVESKLLETVPEPDSGWWLF